MNPQADPSLYPIGTRLMEDFNLMTVDKKLVEDLRRIRAHKEEVKLSELARILLETYFYDYE